MLSAYYKITIAVMDYIEVHHSIGWSAEKIQSEALWLVEQVIDEYEKLSDKDEVLKRMMTLLQERYNSE